MAHHFETFEFSKPAPGAKESGDSGRVIPSPDEFAAARGAVVLAGVADGIGSLAAPRHASKIAVKAMEAYFKEAAKGREPLPLLNMIVAYAHKKIREMGQENAKAKGMGTTMALLALDQEKAHLANVGDTRIYLYREGKLARLTKDQVKKQKNMPSQLEQFLGMPGDGPKPQGGSAPMKVGDVFLVCSDGLHGSLDDKEIDACFKGARSVQEIGQKLADDLDTVGWSDDVTFILVGVLPGAED